MEKFIKDNLKKRIINIDGDYLMSDKLLIDLLNKYHTEQLILYGVTKCKKGRGFEKTK